MSIQIEVEHAGDQATLAVQGDVTIHTSPKLRNALKPLFASKPKHILVNLGGVEFMDSSGIATLVEGLQWSQSSGGRFVLEGLTETVQDVFKLAKLDTIFEIKA